MKILIISGNEPFLRKRCLEDMIKQAVLQKATVSHTTATELLAACEPNPFFSERRLIVVSGVPEKFDLKTLPEEPLTTLVLEVEGVLKETSRLGSWAKTHPAYHRSFVRPEKSWDLPQYAKEFLVEEFLKANKVLKGDLAGAIVSRTTTELGFLAWEAKKILIAMDTDREVTSEHVRGCLATMGEAEVAPLLDALVEHNLQKTVRALQRIEESHPSDPTIKITRFLAPGFVKWLQALYAFQTHGKGAADFLRLNPWYFDNKLLPPARRWGEQGVKNLIRTAARAERALLDGSFSPWNVLVTGILEGFNSAGR